MSENRENLSQNLGEPETKNGRTLRLISIPDFGDKVP